MVTALGRLRSTALGLKEEFSVNLHKYSFSAPTNDVQNREETNRRRSFIHKHYQGLVQGSDTALRIGKASDKVSHERTYWGLPSNAWKLPKTKCVGLQPRIL